MAVRDWRRRKRVRCSREGCSSWPASVWPCRISKDLKGKELGISVRSSNFTCFWHVFDIVVENPLGPVQLDCSWVASYQPMQCGNATTDGSPGRCSLQRCNSGGYCLARTVFLLLWLAPMRNNTRCHCVFVGCWWEPLRNKTWSDG